MLHQNSQLLKPDSPNNPIETSPLITRRGIVLSIMLAMVPITALVVAALGALFTTYTTQPLVITLAADHRPLTAHIGQRFLLKMGDGYNWTVTSTDQTIVSRTSNAQTVSSPQERYEADRPGVASLIARGDPLCRTARPPCPAPVRVISITIIVTP